MVEHQPRNAFDIPHLFYFESKNIHTGSRDALRYRVDPCAGVLHVDFWRSDRCYELVLNEGIEGTAEFPLTQEGFQQMLDFLQTAYDQTPAPKD